MKRRSGYPALDMVVPALAVVAVLVAFRAVNQTPDGLSYAVAVRTGLEMFHPHHLIYVPVARFIHLTTGVDPITATLWQNLVWTFVLGLAAWRLAGRFFSTRTSPVVAALALLAMRGVMIYSVRVETYLPALACLTLATSLAADRPLRPWLLAPTLALAVLYHQTNVLFVLPLLVLLVPGREDPRPAATWWKAVAALTAAGGLVLVLYLWAFRHDGVEGGFWAYALSYARSPIEAWGSFGYFSPSGFLALAVSQLKMILPVRAGAAFLGGPLMTGVLAVLVSWHVLRIVKGAPLARWRLFGLVFLGVYHLFFLWWMPTDMDFFLATLLPLWLLGLILIRDLPPTLRSLPVAGILVLVLASGNLFFTLRPMHRDPGPGRALALDLDRAAPPTVEMITGYSVQQEMLYFTGRTRVHEGDGLGRAVLEGKAPWSGTSAQGPVVVVGGPFLRDLLARDDPDGEKFLRWLAGYDAAGMSCRSIRPLDHADGLALESDRRAAPSWPELVAELRDLSRP